MDLKERTESFSRLGEILRNLIAGQKNKFSEQFSELINNQHLINEWFTTENVRNAVDAIASVLTYANLEKWTSGYPGLTMSYDPLKVGVIMAGNLPLVGFHDYISVLISGNNLHAKTSSKDSEMILFVNDILCDINQSFKEKVKFTDGTISGFDVVIATGSNNSARYFEYYFGKYPNIIRKNRNSIAIIKGDETDAELEALGTDIFSYFGLGCRNVSKIYLPEGCNIPALTMQWERFSGIVQNAKYANNYDFNKAVYIVNKEKFIDTGHLLLVEDKRLSSPVAVLHYEYYKSSEDAIRQAEILKENIQCIIGRDHIPFGKGQHPELWDYSDGVDTIQFLLKKNLAGIL
jgi:hypothetical protein